MAHTKTGWIVRLLSYVSFVCYGAYSIFFPLISVERVSDHWVEILLGSEFMFAGAAMIYGLCTDHFMVWKMGMSVALLGLATISILIGLVGGYQVLAYAFLFGAFAFQSWYGILRERTRREERDIRRQLEEIVMSVRPERTDS